MIPVWRAIARHPLIAIPHRAPAIPPARADIPVPAKKEPGPGKAAFLLVSRPSIERADLVPPPPPASSSESRPPAAITTGILGSYRARGVRVHLWDTLDGFTPELPGEADAALLDDIKVHYDAILAELSARPDLATTSYAQLPLGGRTQAQWDAAQAFADSEWHEHALEAGWSWDELYGDRGVVWEIGADKVISVSELRFIKIDRSGHAESIYRDVDFSPGPKDDAFAWTRAVWEEPPRRPISKFKTPKPVLRTEPTRDEFLAMIGYRAEPVAPDPDTSPDVAERATSIPRGYTKAEIEAARLQAQGLSYGTTNCQRRSTHG